MAKVLVSDVMATHHDRRTAWPDRQSRQRPRAVRITSHRAVLPPCLRQRPILAEHLSRHDLLDEEWERLAPLVDGLLRG